MKKRIFLVLVSILALTGFVSAYYGSYTDFSIGNLLDNLDSSTILLGGMFIISFAFLNFVLSMFFKDRVTGRPNRAVAGTISLVISLMIIYGINKMNYNLEDFFYGLGMSQGFLSTLAPIILIAGAILVIWKLKLKGFFLLFGIGFILIALLTDWVYEKGIITLIGVVMLIIGLWLYRRKKREEGGYGYGGRPGMWNRFRQRRDPEERLRRYTAKQELRQRKKRRF